MTERTVRKANLIVREKETRDLNQMNDSVERTLGDEGKSDAFKQAALESLREEAERINPKGTPPEDE